MKADHAIYTAFEDIQLWDTALAERNLMRAILRTALEDIRKRGEAYRQARQYFLADDDHYLYSFVSICNHLRLCPSTIRRHLGVLGGQPMAHGNEERLAA